MDVGLFEPMAGHGDGPYPAIEGRHGTTFRVRRCGGIAVAELLDVALVRAADIHQFDSELTALIGAGHIRIVLNFRAIRHLSSQVLGIVLKAHRRCVAEGGLLKLCEIQLDVAEVFALTGLGRRIEIHPEERPAIAGAWPTPPRRPPPRTSPDASPGPSHRETTAEDRALPIATSSGAPSVDHQDVRDIGIVLGEAEAEAEAEAEGEGFAVEECESALSRLSRGERGAEEACARDAERRIDPVPGTASAPANQLRLVVLAGRALGQGIEVPEDRLFIGRDPCCRIRAKCPTVSRIHAIIERREGRAFVRDIGSANGTALNDRLLRGDEAALGDGDRLGIGPLRFRVEIEPTPHRCPTPEPPTDPHPSEIAAPIAPPSILCPQCGAAGWIPLDRVLRELLVATGRTAPPSMNAMPPTPELPARLPGMPTLDPNVGAAEEYPLVPPPAVDQVSRHRGVPARLPRSSGGEPAGPTETEDSLDGSLERAVLDALATLECPADGPREGRPEEPDARPRSIRPSVDGLTFVCPGCGAEGRARIDQLDHQLCCTRCLARVYLDASGALVVGDRANTQPQAGRPRIPVPGARREPGQLEVLAAGWSRLTGPIGIAAGVVALLSVVGMARWATAGPDLPPTLDGRARYAAEAFVQDAAGRIRALATPGTSREAGAWMNLVRPHFARGSSGDVRIAVAIAQQDGKKATVRASIAVPGASAPADPRPSPAGRAGPGPGPRIAADGRAIELMLFWERDPRGEWRIDGARTFQSAVRSRFWAASGEALPAADPTGTGIPDASARPSERSGPASRRGPMGPNGDPTRGVKPAA